MISASAGVASIRSIWEFSTAPYYRIQTERAAQRLAATPRWALGGLRESASRPSPRQQPARHRCSTAPNHRVRRKPAAGRSRLRTGGSPREYLSMSWTSLCRLPDPRPTPRIVDQQNATLSPLGNQDAPLIGIIVYFRLICQRKIQVEQV